MNKRVMTGNGGWWFRRDCFGSVDRMPEVPRRISLLQLALQKSPGHAVALACCITVAALYPTGGIGAERLKDIASIEGVRSNELIGYGLIVGLNGTGDKAGSSFTTQGVANMLERMGTRIDVKEIKLANVASVLVTATLPPFARPGTTLDVTLSSIGDSSTLQGGVLVMTPLKGPDGKVYAVAQGPVSVGGFSVEQGQSGEKAQKNHPTVAHIANGASVERAIPYNMFSAGELRVVLRDADFSTVSRVEQVINERFNTKSARAVDASSVILPLDSSLTMNPVQLVAQLGELEVQPDVPARVVINERTGTIIMGDHVRVSTVALAHGNLNVTIRQETDAVQPNALGGGGTAIVNNSDITVGEDGGQLTIVGGSVSLKDVIKGLNKLGASPRDLIAIVQALKKSGALKAELVVM